MSSLPAKVFEEAFEGHSIHFFQDEHGEIFARADEIGLCMTNASSAREANKRIGDICRRHKEDFKGLSVDRKMRSTDGKAYNTKVLKGRGIFLVAFFARSDKAVRFRRWAAQMIEDLALGGKVLVDRSEYQDLVDSSRRSMSIANQCFDAFELMRQSTDKMASLAGALLSERGIQIRREESLRKSLSDFPLFEGELDSDTKGELEDN